MRIFIYECVSAGGLGDDVPASLLREGKGMLDAVLADFRRLPGIEVVTLLDDDERFVEIAAQCEWTLVIAPEFDNLLRQRSQAVLDADGHLLGSLPHAIRKTADKHWMAGFWRGRWVPHPRTEFVDPIEFVKFKSPWVVKPRYGAGSQAMFLINDYTDKAEKWIAAREEWPGDDLIVQQYVEGQPASVALLMGKSQTIPLLPARQHLSRDGRFRYEGGSLPLPSPLAERAVRLALQAVAGIDGLLGYVGVDLVLGDDGNDYAIEINPRLTTSYLGLRQLCQQNLADLILRLAQGETIATPTWSAGTCVIRPH